MRFKNPFPKIWEVYDSAGEVWESYRLEKNAQTFCREMNTWNHFFNDMTFGVRRINAGKA